MKRSTQRILTTHTGSIPRSDELIAIMREKENGRPYDREALATRARQAVMDVVAKQVENGVDVPDDGEQSKSGFTSYQAERLGGFTPAPPQPPGAVLPGFMNKERQTFPEYYERYMKTNMMGAALAPIKPLICTGPVKYTGQAAVQLDISTLKEALKGKQYEEAFLPSANAATLANMKNEYYRSQDEFLTALADAVREEYKAIIDAGLIIQIDDPGVASLWQSQDMTPEERRKHVEKRVEITNYALKGIPSDKVRYHTCYSINQGPLIYTLHLKDFVGPLMRVNTQAVSFEVMNPRHMHDYHTFETYKLPEGKIIIPGMVSHGHNWVEHPELIAEYTTQYARLVGRENVMIGNDCGFASQAGSREVDPKVVWYKFKALSEGAKLASQLLWRK